ncbi:hypothetical protein RchiOBHm_Chr6g0282341 [Rosa chinensis]|uniref:Uncharacterized protein n=1 Tax=Rosa chinensis TaxID=74649 RepID=A0A2P6PTR6_ROSCH|nr:hypothetical protein RchiOBHm_Chr6g0282341 [Rosa chinensis]
MQGYSCSPGTHEYFYKDGRSASWPYLATNLMVYTINVKFRNNCCIFQARL